MVENAEQQTARAGARQKRRRLSVGLLLAVCMALVFSLASDARTSAGAGSEPMGEVVAESTGFSFAYAQAAGRDYSKFSHREPAHVRLPCLLCHRRETTRTEPLRPGHTPCAGCHAEQFAAPSGMLCTICHAAPEGGKGNVKSFPRLASFNMKFDHARHRNVECSTCHKPTGRGSVAFSIPSGFAAHSTCYQCHTSRAQSGGRDISSCGTCHKMGAYTRTPVMTRAFQVNFSHAEHGRDEKLTCNDCHQVKSGMPQRRQVTAPVPAMHFASERAQSCMSCHDGKRAFGGDDFASCKKCHEGQTFRFR